MRVLVVDDVPENRSILAQFLSRMGHRPLEAKNGEEAVALFEAESPDFVIMDVLMPVMDGFDATRRIKALSKDRWTPVLLLTALNRADHLIRGLEMGGDDFISKPFDFSLLTAKIRVFERALALQSQILEKNASLRAMGARIEEEMLLGKHVLDALVAGDRSQEPCVEFWVEPLELFGGDIVLRRRAPDGTLFLFHADSQGHGLSAALGLFPATEVFHAMVDRGFDAEMTLTEMNRKIRELMPPGFFIAVTAVSLSPLRETLSVVNCGNPPAVLIDGRGEVMRRFLSKAPPSGGPGLRVFSGGGDDPPPRSSLRSGEASLLFLRRIGRGHGGRRSRRGGTGHRPSLPHAQGGASGCSAGDRAPASVGGAPGRHVTSLPVLRH